MGEAREWHRYYKLGNLDPSWSQFKEDLLDRFNSDSKNPIDEFKRLQQIGRVDDYIHSYERVKARVLAHQYSPDEFYLLGFLSGLKEEIADAVLLYNPSTLKQAYKLSRQIEKSLESQTKMLRPVFKNFSSHIFKQNKPREEKSEISQSDSVKLPESSNHRSLTLEQKKTLGLCFKCGDKIFPGHKCKPQGILVLENEETCDDNTYSHDAELSQHITNVPDIDQAVITMCAAHASCKHRTFRLQGQIGSTSILAMIDSGNTHSFINPTIVQLLSLPTVKCETLTVITASGTRLTTNLFCENQQFFCAVTVLQVILEFSMSLAMIYYWAWIGYTHTVQLLWTVDWVFLLLLTKLLKFNYLHILSRLHSICVNKTLAFIKRRAMKFSLLN
jgi:Ty3 transposon capsid-like protein/Retroviral aspartyl protease